MNPSAAHGKVAQAVRDGRLTRQPCEVCGATKVDAHHDDYDSPLSVRWLCRKHHRQAHSPARPAGIMVRASLTQDEWTALRKLALDRKARVADLVADALRTVYLEGVKP